MDLGFRNIVNESKWDDMSFVQPNPESGIIHFLRKFSNLNKQPKHKPYQIPNIKETLLKLEWFQPDI